MLVEAAKRARKERGKRNAISQQVLMTNRNRQIGVKFATRRNIVDLPALTNKESSMILTTRLGDNPVDHHDRIKLAEAHGGIPITLSIPGAKASSRPH